MIRLIDLKLLRNIKDEGTETNDYPKKEWNQR